MIPDERLRLDRVAREAERNHFDRTGVRTHYSTGEPITEESIRQTEEMRHADSREEQ